MVSKRGLILPFSLSQIQRGSALFGGSKDKRAVVCFLVGFQINKQFQYFIYDFFRTCFRPVDLIDDAYDDRMI